MIHTNLQPPAVCPLCGAPQTEELSCQKAFDEFLQLEFTDPDYGVVHMLTVASFMIQHQQYSDTALVWIEAQLRAHLAGTSPEYIRRQAQAQVDSTGRSWKIKRAAGDRALPAIAWSMNIVDVYERCEDAASYCALIRAWAQRVLTEMQPMLPAGGA